MIDIQRSSRAGRSRCGSQAERKLGLDGQPRGRAGTSAAALRSRAAGVAVSGEADDFVLVPGPAAAGAAVDPCRLADGLVRVAELRRAHEGEQEALEESTALLLPLATAVVGATASGH